LRQKFYALGCFKSIDLLIDSSKSKKLIYFKEFCFYQDYFKIQKIKIHLMFIMMLKNLYGLEVYLVLPFIFINKDFSILLGGIQTTVGNNEGALVSKLFD
jgi:hypothetical protein